MLARTLACAPCRLPADPAPLGHPRHFRRIVTRKAQAANAVAAVAQGGWERQHASGYSAAAPAAAAKAPPRDAAAERRRVQSGGRSARLPTCRSPGRPAAGLQPAWPGRQVQARCVSPVPRKDSLDHPSRITTPAIRDRQW